ncbi:predicted protein [Cyanophage PSS2]|uniref:hypothetical protein n=1 Tax=Cyanophage PSS2 TaxID=658401 RepID=UPI0001B0403A|nr:hypothetical protein PSS2_gp099 [Cyanophage PSS2]ACT65661.1 hypothetical protein [Cyanophage PSS2]ACY75802.1 predicted protein [Cyanophage PSS2]
MTEKWSTHPGIPGYEVSSEGSIRRCPLGVKQNVPEPVLSKNTAGQPAYWIKPIGVACHVMLKAEGIPKFFNA